MHIDMDPQAVLGIGTKAHSVGDLVQPAITGLAHGWLPTSYPDFRSTLLLCRQKWTFTLYDLFDASHDIGDKLKTSANAVRSADVDSADQF